MPSSDLPMLSGCSGMPPASPRRLSRRCQEGAKARGPWLLASIPPPLAVRRASGYPGGPHHSSCGHRHVMQFLPWVLQGSLQSKAQSAMVVAMMDTCNVWFLCAATSRLENGPPPVHQAGKTSTTRRVEVLAAWCRALSTLPSLKSWATQLRLR